MNSVIAKSKPTGGEHNRFKLLTCITYVLQTCEIEAEEKSSCGNVYPLVWRKDILQVRARNNSWKQHRQMALSRLEGARETTKNWLIII